MAMDLQTLLANARGLYTDEQVATVFGYYVSDPDRYGVVDFDKSWRRL